LSRRRSELVNGSELRDQVVFGSFCGQSRGPRNNPGTPLVYGDRMRPTPGQLREAVLSIWRNEVPPGDGEWRVYSPAEQAANQARLQSFVDVLSCESARAREGGTVGRQAQDRLLVGFLDFACPTLDWDRPALEELLREIPPAMDGFRLEARRFDPSLSAEDIYQGARNAITMLCLQRLLGVRVGMTPAIVGYSLLYPYTDNYLDAVAVRSGDKAAFVARLGERLQGRLMAPASQLERRVFDLVDMIDGQYPRERFPEVFETLSAIHAAQVRSLGLFGRPSAREVIEVSVEKGGMSVLADGYLVAGSLTPAQAECLYALGVFLQLRDDLEDVADDRRRGQATVFSSLPWYRRLDNVTARTLAVGRAVVDRLQAFDAPGAGPVRQLMARSLMLAVTDAAASTSRRYSRRGREALERHSPFRFGFLVEQRRRVSRAQGSFTGVLETWVRDHDAPLWGREIQMPAG